MFTISIKLNERRVRFELTQIDWKSIVLPLHQRRVTISSMSDLRALPPGPSRWQRDVLLAELRTRIPNYTSAVGTGFEPVEPDTNGARLFSKQLP